MFDKHYSNSSKEYVPYEKDVKITEYKAPTDESIALLNEFQEKARKNIVCSFKIDENILKGAFISFQEQFPNDVIKFYLKFTLNNEEYIFKDSIPTKEFKEQMLLNWENQKYNPAEHNSSITRYIIKKFSECIAVQLVQQNPNFIRNIFDLGKGAMQPVR